MAEKKRWKPNFKDDKPFPTDTDSRSTESRGYDFLNKIKETKLGAGHSYHLTKEGMFLGSSQYAKAPFKVDMDGNAYYNHTPSSGSMIVPKSYVDSLVSTLTDFYGGESIYGDGSDGDIVGNFTPFDATGAYGVGDYIIKNGGLQRDCYFNSLTIMAGASNLVTNGFRIFSKGTIHLQNTKFIINNGGDGTAGQNGFSGSASGGSGGTPLLTNSLWGVDKGGNGGVGTNAGVGNGGQGFTCNGGAGSGTTIALGTNGSGGANGGSSTGGSGGKGASGGTIVSRPTTARSAIFTPLYNVTNSAGVATFTMIKGSQSSGGGGGGAGDGTNGGGGGGGGGSAGGMIFIAAKSIVIDNGCGIQATGGNGGHGGDGQQSGNTGGGGGGAGAPGGVIFLIYDDLTINGTGTISVQGGAGANGGIGHGSGSNASGGDNGSNGVLIQLQNK